MSIWVKIPAALLAVVVLGLAGLGWNVQRQFDPPGPDGAPVEVTIPLGSSAPKIAAILEREGVIASTQTFRLYLRLHGGAGFKAGTYTLHRHQAFEGIVARLRKGPDVVYDRLTIPEGFTLSQIAERVGKLEGRSADAFLAAAGSGEIKSEIAPNQTNLEGLLFPDTYLFKRQDDERTILRRMIERFDEVATEVGIPDAKTSVGVSPYDAVIVASLVEREARVPEDRGAIARVVYNRLAKKMLLQVDATVLYALGAHKTRVLNSDLKIASPYNTYLHPGLTPTPIASPGRAALQAALAPPPSDYLFYVVVEANGRHAFASTAAGHAANIRLAQQNGVR